MKEWQILNQIKPRLYIGKAPVIGKFMIYMALKNRSMGVSPHLTLEGAKYGLNQCKRCADSFPSNFWHKPVDYCFSQFISCLNEKFDYPDDDELLGVLDSRMIEGQYVLRSPTSQEKVRASEFFL
ncbi:hypothetical protein GlitD10_0776 [Gloeomargarita lithophora Alchichica-D10]|uniref:Uncharacterized protein n=1 Tax=Gloeomargarita lithophora Alchichica-D10 TaxID=1188229 RepID=A0A1J0AAY1_9CYAN|nr:hypothetical protein [Gloeomargarita lithophora]APB33090.1 hypothetical protein GlitD10_0776 [Gloeomargarita lithophora Alchichica-D10]